ncbi:MAG: sulfotransferase domain-containing protein [Bacteroidota bacterium]
MMKSGPDFIGIGAQKAGTTWLFDALNRLPEFSLPPIKELHYFDRSPSYISSNNLHESSPWKRIKEKGYLSKALRHIFYLFRQGKTRDAKFLARWYFGFYDDNWYLSLFDKLKGLRGEISPSYSILNREDIVKIHQLIPHVKLVFIVRNPIDRAWSHYRFAKGKRLKYGAVEDSIEEIKKFMDWEGQESRSDYKRTIENYASVFPKGQVLLGFHDAMIERPEELLGDILGFIAEGVELQPYQLDVGKVIHKSLSMQIPKEIRDYLKVKYRAQIEFLAEKYGGYFYGWYTDTYTDEPPVFDTPPPASFMV